jgi:hypothetical protein
MRAVDLYSGERVVTLQSVIELVLAVGAILLLARDLRRAWLDQLRRPVTLLMAALIAALLIGTYGARPHPSPWWLLLPAVVLLWELARGWRRVPRCHLWEAGMGAFALSLLLVGLGLSGASVQAALLAAGSGSAAVGAGLLWRSHGREPRPGRIGDAGHYERRLVRRLEV